MTSEDIKHQLIIIIFAGYTRHLHRGGNAGERLGVMAFLGPSHLLAVRKHKRGGRYAHLPKGLTVQREFYRLVPKPQMTGP